MPKPDESEKFDTLTASDVAELLFVSERTVRNWMNKNGLPFSDDGRGRILNWSKVLPWYVEFQTGNRGNGGNQPAPPPHQSSDVIPDRPDETYDEALTRKTVAEADIKELQLAKARGQVAAISVVEKVMSASHIATRTLIEAVPARLLTQVLGMSDRTRLHDILTREMDQLLSNLADINAVREASAESFGEDAP